LDKKGEFKMGLDTGRLYNAHIDVPPSFTGNQWKPIVNAASTAADGDIGLTATIFTIDGYTVSYGQVVFLGFQESPEENGFYLTDEFGLQRITQADTWELLVDAIALIRYGDTYAGHYFRTTIPADGTLDVNPITWEDLGVGSGTNAIQLYGSVNQDTPQVYTFDQYQTFCFNVKLTAEETVQGTIGVYLTNVSGDTPDNYAQTPFKTLTILNGKFHDGVNPDTVISVLDGARTVSALYMVLWWQQGALSVGDARINIFGSITY